AVGCLEAVLGREHLLDRIRSAGATSPVLARLSRRSLAPLDILDTALQAGEPAAAAILDDVVNHLSSTVALSVNLFSPRRVALGGALAQAPKDVVARLQVAIRERVSRLLRDQVAVEPASIGMYPGVLGAGTVALDRLFYRDQPPAPAARGSRRIK